MLAKYIATKFAYGHEKHLKVQFTQVANTVDADKACISKSYMFTVAILHLENAHFRIRGYRRYNEPSSSLEKLFRRHVPVHSATNGNCATKDYKS